jgi:cell division protease FtsH
VDQAGVAIAFFNLQLWMGQALLHFIHSQNGRVVLEVDFDGDKPIEPTYHKIVINGSYRNFLWEGTIFIWFPDEKVVLSAMEDPMGEFLDISIRSNKSSGEFFQRWEKYTRQNNYLFGKAFFVDGSILVRKNKYTWDDIFLPENIKNTIKLNIEGFLSQSEKLRKLGAKGRRGLILAGPPGTGKSLVGKVLSETLDNVSFLWVSPRHIENPGSFDSILSLARFVAPTVLFLEDIDLFAENRDHRGWMGLGELMNQLDGANDNQDIVTIATTNRLEVVENAIRNRPGRFDRVIEFGTMDELCRQNFIKKLLYKAKISPDNIHYLITKTEDFTGAQVEELVNTIFMIALDNDKSNSQINQEGDELTIDHKIIETAFEETKFAPKGWGFGINVA